MGTGAILASVSAPSPIKPTPAQTRTSIWWLVLVIPGTLIGILWFAASGAWTAGVRAFTVPSSSMEPTIQQDDHIIADMTYYVSHKPRDRDVILFQRRKIVFIKRVVACCGETIVGITGAVYVNGQKQIEPYVQHTGRTFLGANDFGPVVVPSGQYFVMGDNRDVSLDSRSSEYGLVSAESITGKPLRVMFNPHSNRIGKNIQ